VPGGDPALADDSTLDIWNSVDEARRPGLPTWPRHDPKKDAIFEFRADGTAGAGPDPRYKQADVHDVAASVVNDTAVVWSRITLTAEVRGADAKNEFTVTEVFQKAGSDWKLLVLTFSSVRPEHQLQK
jgi:hypothetical protein